MGIADALKEWREYYLLVGTAGATLLALLFVAVSLGVGFLSERRSAATRAFFSPVIVHFTAAFVISALALIPAHRASFYATSIGLCALIGGVVSVFATVQLLRHRWTKYVQDHLGYGILPAICYAALLIAAWMILSDYESALDVLAGALVLLVIVNIRNAWDLTLSMVRSQTKRG